MQAESGVRLKNIAEGLDKRVARIFAYYPELYGIDKRIGETITPDLRDRFKNRIRELINGLNEHRIGLNKVLYGYRISPDNPYFENYYVNLILYRILIVAWLQTVQQKLNFNDYIQIAETSSLPTPSYTDLDREIIHSFLSGIDLADEQNKKVLKDVLSGPRGWTPVFNLHNLYSIAAKLDPDAELTKLLFEIYCVKLDSLLHDITKFIWPPFRFNLSPPIGQCFSVYISQLLDMEHDKDTFSKYIREYLDKKQNVSLEGLKTRATFALAARQYILYAQLQHYISVKYPNENASSVSRLYNCVKQDFLSSLDFLNDYAGVSLLLGVFGVAIAVSITIMIAVAPSAVTWQIFSAGLYYSGMILAVTGLVIPTIIYAGFGLRSIIKHSIPALRGYNETMNLNKILHEFSHSNLIDAVLNKRPMEVLEILKNGNHDRRELQAALYVAEYIFPPDNRNDAFVVTEALYNRLNAKKQDQPTAARVVEEHTSNKPTNASSTLLFRGMDTGPISSSSNKDRASHNHTSTTAPGF